MESGATGGLGGQLLGMLSVGAGGGVLMAIIGMIKKAMAK